MSTLDGLKKHLSSVIEPSKFDLYYFHNRHETSIVIKLLEPIDNKLLSAIPFEWEFFPIEIQN